MSYLRVLFVLSPNIASYIIELPQTLDCYACALWLLALVHVWFFFFFSSRRRHTRSLCDWSSDVCSSDLGPQRAGQVGRRGPARRDGAVVGEHQGPRAPPGQAMKLRIGDSSVSIERGDITRSEERRVGKECRSRRATDHETKKKSSRTTEW